MSPGYAAKSQQKIVPARKSCHYDVQPLSPVPATLACGYTSERVTRPTRNCGTQAGLVGANHVKAPPPPLYTFEGLIEFKQLAPKSRIARDQGMFQASHLGFPASCAVMISS